VDVNLGRHDGQFMARSSGQFRMKVEPLVEYRGRGTPVPLMVTDIALHDSFRAPRRRV